MGIRNYHRILLCVGAAAIAGVLNGGEASAATLQKGAPVVLELSQVQNSLLTIKDIWRCVGAEHPYIEGLEEIGSEVLDKLAEAEAKGEEIVLFGRVRDLSGTRVFANVSNYVNVRKSGSTSSEVVGKLYADCVATVIAEEGNWVYVNSGNVTGYVVKDYLLLGDEAEAAIAKKYAPKVEVTANVLNVRSGAGTSYNVVDTFQKGDTAELLEQGKEWMKIRFKAGEKTKTGYVYATYVKVTGEPKYGETLAEEKERIAAEKKAAAEAAANPVVEEKVYGEPDPVEPIKEEYATIDDFGKLDLRVCKIVKCQEIRKSHSCYMLKLFDGIGERVIVSSIKHDYKAEELVGKKMKDADKSPLEIWKQALENITPQVEVKSKRIGGATFQVPMEVRPERKISISMKNLVLFSRKRAGKTMAEKLSAEILDAYNQQGAAFKRKEEMHRMAEANKAFAHFRF